MEDIHALRRKNPSNKSRGENTRRAGKVDVILAVHWDRMCGERSTLHLFASQEKKIQEKKGLVKSKLMN